MPGIPLVARKVDGAVNENRQVSVHLDDAEAIPFIPIIAAPRFIVHVLDRKAFS